MAGTVKRGVIVVLAVGGGALSAYGLWAYVNHDRVDFIDDPAVVEIAERACAQMQREIVRAGEEPLPEERHVVENEAVLAMVDEIRRRASGSLGDDRPSEEWLTDWERLVAARASGDMVPTVDGRPLSERMDELARVSGIDVCRVPKQLRGP